MSNEPETTEYLVLFRSTNWSRDLSVGEMQQIMERTYEWFDKLRAAGTFRAAQPLFNEGRVLVAAEDGSITDGPFAESKEIVGGYLILRAASMDDAVEIARGWPLLALGATLEVRPIAQECPDFQRLRNAAA